MNSSSFSDKVGGLFDRLPSVNVSKFQRNIALNFMKRGAKTHFWPILDLFGPARISWMIQNNKHFCDLLPEEVQQTLRQQAPQIKWMIDVLPDNDLLELLPPWVVELSGSSDEGRAWIESELVWLREQCRGAK